MVRQLSSEPESQRDSRRDAQAGAARDPIREDEREEVALAGAGAIEDGDPLDDTQETLLLVPLLAPPGAAGPYSTRPQRVVLRPAVRHAARGLWTRPLTLAVLVCLGLLLVAGALDGMQQYARIRAQTLDAVAHIHAAQTLLDSAQPSHPLDATTLGEIDAELSATSHDAALLSAELGAPSGSVLVASALPGLSARLASAAAFAAAADSACQAGRALIAGSLLVLELRAGGFLDARGQLTRQGRASPSAADLIQQLQADATQAATQLDLAVARARGADLGVLPPSVATPSQRTTLLALFAAEPDLHARLSAPGGWQFLAQTTLGAAPLGGLLAGI